MPQVGQGAGGQADSHFCAICQSDILTNEFPVRCPDCNAIYHKECWEQNQGCAVYGCSQVPSTEHLETIEIPASYWGQEYKKCPVCGAQIKAAALRCRLCGSEFPSAQPETVVEFRKRATLEQIKPKFRQSVIILFVFCCLPCTAPIAAIIGLPWYLSKRVELDKLTSLYPALARIGLIVGFVQLAIMVIMTALYAFLRA
ncbi:RING finger protein [Acidobacteriota bacterium]